MNKEKLVKIIKEFNIENLENFLFDANFIKEKKDISFFNSELIFENILSLGKIKTDDNKNIIVVVVKVKNDLSEKSSRKKQYELSKKILSREIHDAGIFVFYDNLGCFRFSLVCPTYSGTKRNWNVFRRYTYFVNNNEKITNKTFIKQIGEGNFSTLNNIKEAFSLSAVTNIFYQEFFIEYDKLVESVKKINNIKDHDIVRDFILLFVIRIIFAGFVEKKGWIGNDENFIQNLFIKYEKYNKGNNLFYKNWLSSLFFESFNNGFSKKDYLPEDVNNDFKSAPYLNGGLFKKKSGYDDNQWIIPDKEIKDFFDFIFAHSFTIEENSLEDEDLQLNPEFLGIIFERLVNKADGAVYTPKIEVDLMCRLGLLKWLQKKLEGRVKIEDLYELFFKEGNNEKDQKYGNFSKEEAEEVLFKLENIAVCDPAVGSGAFLVGMMQVIDDVEQILKNKYELSGKDIFERKKEIIKKSLFGVEVKEWAVWICQLRLWLSLFVDAPESLRYSKNPILPSLDFKVRQGDSLIQRIGSKLFPISGHSLSLSKSVKDKITKLKNLKQEYFDNKSELKDWELKQREIAIYEEILDLEIESKGDELKNLKNFKKNKNLSLFIGDEEPEQSIIEFDKEKVKNIESQIEEIKEEKKLLRKDKPLVWGIEFADVFGEKGGFDIIIGNPPYIRQELISDPTGKIKDKKQYKELLEEMVRLDFPNEFSIKNKINAKSDLYIYFYIRGLKLLNPQGMHVFICSNSWLDVGYGVWFQDFILKHCPIELIIDNQAKRSFEAADINTIISIIHAPQRKVDENRLIKFVAIKKSFDEAIFTDNLLKIEKTIEIEKNDIFRIYPISIKNLKDAGTDYNIDDLIKIGNYIGDKWGSRYLRAPDIFFEILKKGTNKLTKINDVADIKFGIKTGCNDFFYLKIDDIEKWRIEKEFLKPIIKSPKESKSISINIDCLQFKIFICNKNKKELIGTNALKYIEWGESQKNNEGIFWKDIKSVKNRKHWYSLNYNPFIVSLWPRIHNNSHRIYKSDVVAGDTFSIINFKNKNDKYNLLLNSTIVWLQKELFGRHVLGEGGLSSLGIDLIKLLIPKEELINIKIKNFDNFNKREIMSVFDECGIDPNSKIPIEEQDPKPLRDRAELDNIIFDELKLTSEERKDVYRSVCRLVWNRISRASSL